MPLEFFLNPKSKSLSHLKVGVLAGGISSERKISIRSGTAVLNALKNLELNAQLLDPAHSTFSKKILKIDIAFIALHGHGGEDGTIQKFLDRHKIPFVGSEATSSLRAFNKVTAKKVFRKNNIPTADHIVVDKSNWKSSIRQFGTPCFIKPLEEGSSIGAFAIEDLTQAAEKIKRTLRAFGPLLVEKKINGRELTVGVLGNRALPVIEMRPKGKFYDFKSKYTKGMTDYIVPAKIHPKLAKKLQRIALDAHHALGLRDLSRIDIMLDANNQPYVLEANTIPGFTELSLLPKAAQAVGITFENLCLSLLSWAYQRHIKGARYGEKEKA